MVVVVVVVDVVVEVVVFGVTERRENNDNNKFYTCINTACMYPNKTEKKFSYGTYLVCKY